MPFLIMLTVATVVITVLFWRLATQSRYRVKNRDEADRLYRPRSRMENAPNLNDMLD